MLKMKSVLKRLKAIENKRKYTLAGGGAFGRLKSRLYLFLSHTFGINPSVCFFTSNP